MLLMVLGSEQSLPVLFAFVKFSREKRIAQAIIGKDDWH